MRPFFGCPPYGGRTTIFNNNYYSMPPMMGCGCQSNFFDKMYKWSMMSSLMQNLFRPMVPYYPQQSYYPGLYLSGGGTEGAGGASKSSSEQNLKNLQEFYVDCRFTSITEDGVTRYYCSTPNGTVYTDTSLTDLQKQLEINGVTPKQKKEKSEIKPDVSSVKRDGEVDDAEPATDTNPTDEVSPPENAHRRYNKADLSKLNKPNYIWIKYNDLSDAQKEKLNCCKTIKEVMEALNSETFGSTNLKIGNQTLHNWYKDANPNAIDGDNIVDITKLDLIVRDDYQLGSNAKSIVRSGDGKFAYYADAFSVKYYQKNGAGVFVECTENDVNGYNTMKSNAKNKHNSFVRDNENKYAYHVAVGGEITYYKNDNGKTVSVDATKFKAKRVGMAGNAEKESKRYVKSSNGKYCYYVGSDGTVKYYKKVKGQYQVCDEAEFKKNNPTMYTNSKNQADSIKSNTRWKSANDNFHAGGH